MTSNTLPWTKASACQTVANNATVTLIALLILYVHIRVIARVPLSSPLYLLSRGGSQLACSPEFCWTHWISWCRGAEQQSSKTASKSKVKSKPQQVRIYRSFSTNSVGKSGQLQRTKNLHLKQLSPRLRNPSAKFKSYGEFKTFWFSVVNCFEYLFSSSPWLQRNLNLLLFEISSFVHLKHKSFTDVLCSSCKQFSKILNLYTESSCTKVIKNFSFFAENYDMHS